MRILATVIAALSVLLGCVHAQQHSTARSETILLRVISSADNATRIPGAEIFRLGENGVLAKIGETDVNGEVKIRRSSLPASSNVVAVVVCHPVFFCGALRAEYLAPRDEATIALAPMVTD